MNQPTDRTMTLAQSLVLPDRRLQLRRGRQHYEQAHLRGRQAEVQVLPQRQEVLQQPEEPLRQINAAKQNENIFMTMDARTIK